MDLELKLALDPIVERAKKQLDHLQTEAATSTALVSTSANKMDERPFFEFDIRSMKKADYEALRKFAKGSFDDENVTTAAQELLFTRGIVAALHSEFSSPSEDFVRYFSKLVYQGTLGKNASRSRRRRRRSRDDAGRARGLRTRESIMAPVVNPARVVMRDTKSYCGVLLDDNNRKPICRLRFNAAQKYLGLFSDQKVEEKIPIRAISEIYQHAERLRAVVGYYPS